MVIEVIRYNIPIGEEAAFEDAIRGVGELLEASSHCLGYSLTRAVEERQRYLIIIYWDSPDGHLIGFRQSTAFKDYERHLRPYDGMTQEDAHYRKTGIELTKKQLVRLSGQPK